MEKILVLNVAGIGDCIDSIPALLRLRRFKPGAFVRLVVSEKSAPLACCFPMVDDVVGLPTSRGQALPKWGDSLRWGWAVAGLRDRYAMVINLYRTASWAGRSWMRFISVLAPSPVRIEPIRMTANRLRSCNQVEDFLQIVDRIAPGADAPSHALQPKTQEGLVLPPNVMSEVQRSLNCLTDWKGLTGPLVVVALGGDRRTRHESPERAERWLALLQERWRVRPILIGTARDPGLPAGSTVRHVDVRGRWDIVQTAALIASADVVVSTDSAPPHLAAVWMIPTVILVGPGDATRYRPSLSDDALRQLRHAVPCAPCYYDICPFQGADHQRCMSHIAPEEVARAFGELMTIRQPSCGA